MVLNSTDFIENVLLKGLNDAQRQSVTHTYLNNTLVLAGAGAGKTSVIARRMAFIVAMGHHTDSIVAVTFTTKAAKELKERVALYIGDSANKIMMGTFHSICLKLLRQFACQIGYTNQFNILDPADSKDIVEEIMKRTVGYADAQMLTTYKDQISLLKNRLITPDMYDGYVAANLESDYTTQKNSKLLASVYRDYENSIRQQNSMDFDDLIVNMIRALSVPSVRSYCQNRFKFVMCDEAQDTNTAQFKLLEELAGYNNIFLVGDVDQSIYGWRGAKMENMFEFLQKYPNAQTIKLVQNYRSTGTIVEASNVVIKNNLNRFEKVCFTNNTSGEKIRLRSALDSSQEVCFVVDEIQRLIAAGHSYKDIAILYRINALGSEFEKELVTRRVPYSVVRGTSFYQRAEIKDVIAILKAANNPNDSASMGRYLKTMPGIGATTIQSLTSLAQQYNTTLINAANLYVGKSKNSLQSAVNIIAKLNQQIGIRADQFVEMAIRESGYLQRYKQLNSGVNADRIENIQTFIDNAVKYSKENPCETVPGLLDNIALISGDDRPDDSDTVKLMTVHASKGLEYKVVFVIGLEENTFPYINLDELSATIHREEERRLFYVAITRAKERLYLTNSCKRMMNNVWRTLKPSPFLAEVPRILLQYV